jgi:AcrR family transcriptional regulator
MSDDRGGMTIDGEAAVRRRTGGRSARNRTAVLTATWETLLELGVEGLTFSEIGRRANVHGTSVQRRWGSRENLLFETLITYATDAIAVPDTGSLRDDLVAFSKSMAAYFATPIGGSIIQMLIANADNDPAFAAQRAEFVRLRFQAMGAMIRRAAARGELAPGIDEEIALDLALGPLYVRTLITRRPIDDVFIERFVDILMRGLRSNGSIESAKNSPKTKLK